MARASTRCDEDEVDVSYVRRGTATSAPERARARDERPGRFHGAFEGGFSAGHFNTVGTRDGWTPSAFRASRSDRTARREQTVADFMDEDELAAHEATTLRAREAFDTFGDGARESHRVMAWDRASRDGGGEDGAAAIGRSSAVADLLVAPAESGIGARLLRKLGRARRRRGEGMEDGRGVVREVSDVPAYVTDPKNDRRGIGYDAFAGAEEFRDAARTRRRQMEDENSGRARGRKRGEAFGVSVLEEEDESLYDEDAPKLHEYAFELEEEEDEDERMGGKRRASGAVMALGAALPNDCVVRGFHVSSDTLAPPKWFAPPSVPRDFRPRAPVSRAAHVSAEQPILPPEAPPPADAERKKIIDTLATFVAKHGRQFEDMAKARQGEDDEKFSFLFGGRDSGYYKWRLAKAAIEVNSSAAVPPERRSRPLGMEERAKLLGEELLPSTASATEATKMHVSSEPPARKKLSIEGIAAGDRERIQKLLSKTFTSGGIVEASTVEKAGLHVLEKSAPKPEQNKQEEAERAARVTEMPLIASRSTMPWAPEPLLCKRFGIQDPFAGRARPDVTQYKFRTDVLSLDATSSKALADSPKYLEVPPPPPLKTTEVAPPPPRQISHASAKMVEVPPPPPPPPFVEKPLGLFKAIFEDSDDDEAEEEENETEADVDVIKVALATKDSARQDALSPAPPAGAPMWSSAVMAKPPSERQRDRSRERDRSRDRRRDLSRDRKRDRDRKSSKRKHSKKEKREKKEKRRADRKHRKRSRRDNESNSTSSSDSYSD